MRLRAPAAACFVMLAVAGCRSAGPVVPFPAVSALSRDATWDSLLALRHQFAGARAFAHVRVTDQNARRSSFDAKLSVDRDGRLSIDALTPLGTTAFTLFADGDQAVWIDHIHSTWWRGTVADLARTVTIVPRGVSVADLAFLLLGLPPGAGTSRDSSSLVVEAGGMARAVLAGTTFEFIPPAFPPQKVHVADASGTIDVTYNQIGAAAVQLTAPAIPSGYLQSSPGMTTPQ